jgi:hypothetical protein
MLNQKIVYLLYKLINEHISFLTLDDLIREALYNKEYNNPHIWREAIYQANKLNPNNEKFQRFMYLLIVDIFPLGMLEDLIECVISEWNSNVYIDQHLLDYIDLIALKLCNGES